jgi:hypothetical protein
MWIESVDVLHIDAGTGVVGFSKGVGRVARTYRIDDFYTYGPGDLLWLTSSLGPGRKNSQNGVFTSVRSSLGLRCIYLAFCVAALSRYTW